MPKTKKAKDKNRVVTVYGTHAYQCEFEAYYPEDDGAQTSDWQPSLRDALIELKARYGTNAGCLLAKRVKGAIGE